MQFEAYKVVTSAGLKDQPSACNVLTPPQLVAHAEAPAWSRKFAAGAAAASGKNGGEK